MYPGARRFVAQLRGSIKQLGSANAPKLLGLTASGAITIQRLVRRMTTEGLSFAPATPGDDDAYWALYHALRNYHRDLKPCK